MTLDVNKVMWLAWLAGGFRYMFIPDTPCMPYMLHGKASQWFSSTYLSDGGPSNNPFGIVPSTLKPLYLAGFC